MTVQSFKEVGDDTQKVEFEQKAAREIARWAPLEGSGVDEIIQDNCVSTAGRWTDKYELIVKDYKGRFWRSYYSQGSTEQQATQPYEHGNAEFVRVTKECVRDIQFLSKKEKEKYWPERGIKVLCKKEG